MDFFEAVEKRYSHKGGFLADCVPLENLERIAKAGLAAPSGGNSQCVRLVILRNADELEGLRRLSPNHGGLATAPAAIAVLTKVPTGDINFEVEDSSLRLKICCWRRLR